MKSFNIKRGIFWGLTAFLLCGCKVVDDAAFDDISTQRIMDYIEDCDAVLGEAPNGWKLVYYPDATQYGAYTFLMDFDRETNAVRMVWDGNEESSVSTYSFNTSQGPVLNFDTYSVLHLLSDPNPDVLGGKAGLGYNGEYEFVIKGVSEDKSEIYLETKKGRLPVTIVRATAGDWERHGECIEMQGRFVTDQAAHQRFYRYIEIDGQSALFFYSPGMRMAYVAYAESETATKALKLPYQITPEGIRFSEEVTFAGVTFEGFSIDEGGTLSLLDPSSDATVAFTGAASNSERSRLKFWGSVESSSMANDGFNMVDHGMEINNLFTEANDPEAAVPRTLKEIRFYWNLQGMVGGEIYLQVPRGSVKYARQWDNRRGEDIGDTVGDQILMTQGNLGATVAQGATDQNTHNWFSLTPGYGLAGGTLGSHFLAEGGHTVIDFGGQMVMIRNSDNRAWALYSPKENLN